MKGGDIIRLWNLTIEYSDGIIEHITDSFSWCLLYVKILKKSVKRFKLSTAKEV